MDKNIFEDYSSATGTTLKVLLIKYRNEITVNKKGAADYGLGFLPRELCFQKLKIITKVAKSFIK